MTFRAKRARHFEKDWECKFVQEFTSADSRYAVAQLGKGDAFQVALQSNLQALKDAQSPSYYVCLLYTSDAADE